MREFKPILVIMKDLRDSNASVECSSSESTQLKKTV